MKLPKWPIDPKQPFRSVVISYIDLGVLKVVIRDVFQEFMKKNIPKDRTKDLLQEISNQQYEQNEMETNTESLFFKKDQLSFEHYCSMKFPFAHECIMKMIQHLKKNNDPRAISYSASGDWYEELKKAVIRDKFVVWLDLKKESSNLLKRNEWCGSSLTGAQIFDKYNLTGDISQFFTLVNCDTVFRRAIISIPEILHCFKDYLRLSDKDMFHTCMLPFVNERAVQIDSNCKQVEMWGSDVFRSIIKYDQINDLQSYVNNWTKDFTTQFGS